MRLHGAVIGLALAATGAGAQPDAEYGPLVPTLATMLEGCLAQSYDPGSVVACDDLTSRACNALGPGGDTTYGMAQCTVILTDLWDRELNRVWPEALAASEPSAERLREEQRAWIAHRDAACDFAVAQAQGGTMAAYVGGYCLMRMTAERVADLRGLLR